MLPLSWTSPGARRRKGLRPCTVVWPTPRPALGGQGVSGPLGLKRRQLHRACNSRLEGSVQGLASPADPQT